MMSLPVWLPGPVFLSGEGGLCPEGLCQGDPSRQRLPLYTEEWTVRILLECFFVNFYTIKFKSFIFILKDVMYL